MKIFSPVLSSPLLLLLVLIGCNNPTVLKVEFENVSGVDNKSPVLVRGLRVGNIRNFKVQPDSKILVEIVLDSNLNLKQDTKFVISSLDIFGAKGITIENGRSQSPIDPAKIQQGENEKPFNDSSIVSAIKNAAEKLSTQSKLDSIEKELKVLNKKMETLKKRK